MPRTTLAVYYEPRPADGFVESDHGREACVPRLANPARKDSFETIRGLPGRSSARCRIDAITP